MLNNSNNHAGQLPSRQRQSACLLGPLGRARSTSHGRQSDEKEHPGKRDGRTFIADKLVWTETSSVPQLSFSPMIIIIVQSGGTREREGPGLESKRLSGGTRRKESQQE